MDCNQLRTIIINPTLKTLAANGGMVGDSQFIASKEAEDLMVGTFAQESDCGKYIKQINGPALGYWQMEPATHDDIWRNFIRSRTKLYYAIGPICKIATAPPYKAEDMIDNIKYALVMARIKYLRVKESIPSTLEGQAQFWKTHYNTALGKGTVEQYIANYHKFNNTTPIESKEAADLAEAKVAAKKIKQGV